MFVCAHSHVVSACLSARGCDPCLAPARARCASSTLLGLRIADGSLVWTYPPPPARVDSLFGAAIVLGGSLWFGVADAPIHAGSGGSGGGSGGALEAAFPAVRLYGVNVLTGALVCRSRPLSGAGGRVGTGPVALSKPVVLNGEGSTIVVFTDGSGVTHALDAICQPLWEREIGAAFVTEHGMSAVRLPRPAWGLHTDGSLQARAPARGCVSVVVVVVVAMVRFVCVCVRLYCGATYV